MSVVGSRIEILVQYVDPDKEVELPRSDNRLYPADMRPFMQPFEARAIAEELCSNLLYTISATTDGAQKKLAQELHDNLSSILKIIEENEKKEEKCSLNDVYEVGKNLSLIEACTGDRAIRIDLHDTNKKQFVYYCDLITKLHRDFTPKSALSPSPVLPALPALISIPPRIEAAERKPSTAYTNEFFGKRRGRDAFRNPYAVHYHPPLPLVISPKPSSPPAVTIKKPCPGLRPQ